MVNQFRTRKEIADMYGISPKTLVCRLAIHGIILVSGRVSPADFEKIITVLGDPKSR